MKKIFDCKVFVDCGAPSLYNRLSRGTKHYELSTATVGTAFNKRKQDDFSYVESAEYKKYRLQYIQFLHRNKRLIDVYPNLDVINNPELTINNQRILEEHKLHPIPVFHLRAKNEKEEVRRLEYLVRNYEYIALGGMTPNPTPVADIALARVWQRYLLDRDGFPRVKVHGFACTSPRLMTQYPWYSVDSASARKLANYGQVWMDNRKNKLRPCNFFMSMRDMEKNKGKQLPIGFRYPDDDVKIEERHRGAKGKVSEIAKKAHQWELPIEELHNKHNTRLVFNYLYQCELLTAHLPAWPWSYFTHKSKKGADEYMTLYLAGSLSKKEELEFWTEIAKHDLGNMVKARLCTFFYPTQAQFFLDKKKGEYK